MDIRPWIRGDGQKSDYIKSIGLVFGIMFGGLLAAIIFYEPPFSFLWVEVSDLAVTTDNPVGGVIIAACFIVAGLLLAPHGLYLFKMLQSPVRVVAGASGTCLFASGIGFSLVGLFPYDINSAMHLAGAFVAIGGLALSSWLSIVPVAKKLARKTLCPTPWHVLVVYGQLFVIEFIAIVLAGVPIVSEITAGTFVSGAVPPLWPPCEWASLFSAVIWVVGMMIIEPRQIDGKSSKQN